MRRLVVALSLLSVALAGTTIYFARQLAYERARPVATMARPESAPAPRARLAAAPAAAATRTPAGAAAKPEPARDTPAARSFHTMTDQEVKASQMQFAKAFLAQIADPQAREDLIGERRMQMRQTFPALERVVGLSADEYAQLLNLLAEQQLDLQTQHSRCVVDPACNSQQWHTSDQSHQQAITALLGADRVQKFESYKNTLGERESVTQMRARLPDSQRLSDANAEGLVAALAEERAALSRETAARGDGFFGFGIGAGMLFAPSEGTPDAQYEAARQYSQRLRERAAPYLNSEQLRLFNEMQDDQLLAFRNMLRNKDGTYSTVTHSSPP
jgi:hypothetical protein